MSETVHYRGKLTPTGKTLKEFASNAYDIYDLDESAVEIDGKVFLVERESVDHDCDIFNAIEGGEKVIKFEVRYYNGGGSFYEAIDTAIKSCVWV